MSQFKSKINKLPDRVISFSIKPTDKQSLELLQALKNHSDSTGISFSFLMIRALSLVTKELKLIKTTTEEAK